MALYRIFYLRESEIARFRDAAPKEERPCRLKPRRYEESGEIEAESPYEAWQRLQGEEAERRGLRPMGVGDALQIGPETLVVCNFWGFDQAEWQLTEYSGPGSPASSDGQPSPEPAVSPVAEEPAASEQR